MDLETLLRFLIEEQGLTEDEAMRVAAARIKAARGGANQSIQRRSADPLVSPQEDGRLPVSYGEETPEQAKQRWLEQERNDPNGIYSYGGGSSGGIFGTGAIAMDDYDPEAVNRNVEAISRMQQMQVQNQMAHILERQKDLLEYLVGAGPERRQLPAEEEEPERRLDDGRGSRRRLGKKR